MSRKYVCDGGREALRGDERLLSVVLEELPAMVVVTDGRGCIYHLNEAVVEEAGYERDDLIGSPIETLLSGYDDDTDGVELKNQTGERFPVRVQTRTLPSAPDIETEGMVALLIEKTPNSAIGADQTGGLTGTDSLDRVFEHADDAVFLIDVETDRFLRHNDTARELLGYDPEAFGSVRPSDIHPHDYEAFREFAEEVFEYGHGWTDQLSCQTCTGELIEAEISGTAVVVDGQKLLLATVRDVSTRVEQERELLRWSTALAAVTDGISIVSDDNTIRYANEAYASLFGYEDPDAIVGQQWRDRHEPPDRFELEIAPETRSSGEWQGDATGVRADGSTFPIDLSLTRLETGDFVCVARDVTEKRQHERRLNGLLKATRELMAAEDRTETASVAVAAAVDALGYEITTLRLYDEAENNLRRSATTEAAEELLESEVAYDLKASNAGRAYRTGETVCNEPTDDAYAAPSSRADLHVPIGDLGVLTVIDPDEAFSDTDMQLVELLGESIRAALNRADREARLQERRAELERQRDELAATDQFNTLVVDVIQSILGSTTRAETSEAVCERLANSSLYDAACILTLDDSEITVETGSIAENTSLVSDPETFADSPFVRRLIEESTDDSGVVTSRRHLDSQRGKAETLAAAVPIACGPQTFGRLVIATTDPSEFGDAVQSGFAVLGEALGFAFLADRRQKTLRTGDSVELEFAYDSAFGDLSAEFDCRCLHQHAVETEGTPTYRIKITDGDCSAIEDFLLEYPSIEHCTVVSDRGDECVIHAVVDNPPPDILARTGVNLRSLIAENGETRIVVEVASDIDVDTIANHLEEHWEGVRLVAKRQRSRPLDTLAVDGEDRLTSRQRSVLQTAYENGYYEWPREQTAEEIAESLDIASSTLHQHLRSAERKLISGFLSE
jgi:PAS domain S-box-containing protein